jgi:pyruvate/2-oxoglutarate/acetoin dehydrogenase E1 component
MSGIASVDSHSTAGNLAPMRDTVTDAAMQEMNLVTAINHTLRAEMRRDEHVRLIGYDIGPIGGVFRATEGLYAEFGGERVIETPLSENGILGTAVGLAMRGERPVAEIQFLGFMYNAWGQFVYSLANLHQKSGGRFRVPVTVRTPFGGGIRAIPFHSESTETYLVHTPGIRVLCPSTPAEAKGLLTAAIRCDDPVVFLEHAKLYRAVHELVPLANYELPLDKCRTVQNGDDVTVLTWGAMVHTAVEAAASIDASVEIIDLRVLAPLDAPTMIESVRKTGRCVIVHEARRTLGLGAELAALMSEHALDSLRAPVCRVTAFDVFFPENPLEDFYLPGVERVRHGLEAVLNYRY